LALPDPSTMHIDLVAVVKWKSSSVVASSMLIIASVPWGLQEANQMFIAMEIASKAIHRALM
jgi:hypothetical protein